MKTISNMITIILVFIVIASFSSRIRYEIIHPEPAAISDYYDKEVFDDRYQDIYGKWELKCINGGLTGFGYDPGFEVLEILPFGCYRVLHNDSVVHKGRIFIEKQTPDVLVINLEPESNSVYIFNTYSKQVELSNEGNTLKLAEPSYDLYLYDFRRK